MAESFNVGWEFFLEEREVRVDPSHSFVNN